MALVLLLIAFVAQTTALSVKEVVQQQCSQGPQFWCHDLQNAVLCNKVEFCSTLMWNDSRLDLPRNQVKFLCPVCVAVIQSLKNRIGNHSSRRYIFRAIKGVCGTMSWFVRFLCHRVIDHLVEPIAKLLAEHANPQKVCNSLSFCWGDKVHLEDALLISGQINQGECGACQSFVAQMKLSVNNEAYKAEISRLLDTSCDDIFHSLPECKSFVTTYKHELIKALMEPWDYKMACEKVSMCVAAKHDSPANHRAIEGQ
ncbi:prosaposin-like [Protopterus annectens]|uniref:prosaposin-like n=1 Tax=Protopterus annectens TaxID=7888 RepID=UPI001CF99C45|nr:prosaposin-like [Protopterus annectens]XP_043940213.1 prosaposin-like [Protopterus annectens]XP_043940215.1 prosaposin-like [Protopterus annectens]